MSARMRFRTDGDRYAEAKGLGRTFEQEHSCKCGRDDCPLAPSATNRALWDATPAAEPGDTWRVHWYRPIDYTGPELLAGYAICCPGCRHVHRWTGALNCASKRERESGVVTCDHNGVASCWTWTGSAEDGTLTASPSLHAVGACGWHGWLQNGELRG